MTFCPFWQKCKSGKECGRAETIGVQLAADKMGLPWSLFVEKPDCFEEE